LTTTYFPPPQPPKRTCTRDRVSQFLTVLVCVCAGCRPSVSIATSLPATTKSHRHGQATITLVLPWYDVYSTTFSQAPIVNHDGVASRIIYLIHCHVCVCMCAWHGVCVCVCFHVRVFVRVCVLFGLTGLTGPFFSCHDLHVGPIMVASTIVCLIPIMLANRIVYLIHPCKIC
jgi:hypothetical protein